MEILRLPLNACLEDIDTEIRLRGLERDQVAYVNVEAGYSDEESLAQVTCISRLPGQEKVEEVKLVMVIPNSLRIGQSALPIPDPKCVARETRILQQKAQLGVT